MKEEWITHKEACKLLNTTTQGLGRLREKHKFTFKIVNPNYTNPSKVYLKSDLLPYVDRIRRRTPTDTFSKHTTPHGYVLIKIPSHPNSDAQGYYGEHRYVMEKKLNRLLTPTEVVHHINNKRDDNRPENLVLYKNQADHFIIAHKLTSEILALARIPKYREKIESFIAKLTKENK